MSEDEIAVIGKDGIWWVECRIDYVMYFIDDDGHINAWRHSYLSEDNAKRALALYYLTQPLV